MSRRAGWLLALTLVACGGPSAEVGATPDVDSTLVDALADLHLADARAALAADSSRRPLLAESLRSVALRANGLTPQALDARLNALAADPSLAVATYDALESRLSLERRGSPP